MKKLLSALFALIFITMVCRSQSLHGISFNDIDGNSISLSAYQGKRMLFIIASINNDSVRLDEIQKFRNGIGSDSLQLIGIMSIEDGYQVANKDGIKSLYQIRGIDIILTEGMYTKKSAGDNQSSIMRFLTRKAENSKFETEPRGIGQKYYISKTGKLLGIAPPEASLFGNISQALISRDSY